jgi:uncharacterized membrane protein
MSEENVVVVAFTEESKAQQALSVLEDCGAEGRIGLRSTAIVERTPAGELRKVGRPDKTGAIGTVGASLIGMLIGALGGPVGTLLGWSSGAVASGAYDVNRVADSDEALGVLGRAIPAGTIAVVADVEETAPEVIDGEMSKLGGEVTRRPVTEVMAEISGAEETTRAAAHEARRSALKRRLHAS